MVKIQLNELLTKIDGAELSGNGLVQVSGISLDSRKIVPGDIYVCIPGFKHDGHDFASEAIKAGASALLVQRFLDMDIPQVKVESTRKTVGYLAAEIYGRPSEKLELVGVTGTNGKTTVTHLIEAVARSAGRKTGMIGTLGAKIADTQLPGDHTTPESPEIQHLLRQMLDSGVELAVMEVSSHALDLGRVNGCVYRSAVFTNLSQDHLDYHENMNDYLEAKSLLFSGLSSISGQEFAVLNADDPSCPYLLNKTSARAVTYAIDREADFRAENIRFSAKGIELEIRFKDLVQGDSGYQESVRKVFYQTPGKFSVYNVLAAFAWGVTTGYDPEGVSGALAALKGVPGRFENIDRGQPFLVIVDYAHTPDGLDNVLRTARGITSGRLIAVFGCGGDRDRKKRPLMGEAASRFSDHIIVTSDNPRTEDPEMIIADILPGIGGTDYEVIPDRRQAIAKACGRALPGDTVVVAGKGHEDYQITGSIKIHFDDREEVRKALSRYCQGKE